MAYLAEPGWSRAGSRWLMATAVLACSAASAQVMQEREVFMGIQQRLDFPLGVQRLALADDTVVGVQVQRRQGPGNPAELLVTGLKPGNTSLMVWSPGHAQPSAYVLKVRNQVELQQGQSNSLADSALRQAIAKAAGGDKQQVDASSVRMKSNVVQVDVKVVELNKTRLQQAGMNLFSTGANSQGFSFGLLSAGSASGAAFNNSGGIENATSPFSQAFGLLMNFGKANLSLNLGMLEGSGMARVLAEPSLVAISGQSANFLAGGEVPIPVAQGNGATNIEYKSYGVGLTVSPTVIDDNRIVLKVAPESSELDYANAVTLQSVAVPAITTRRADTTVELGDGESFVIGGLVSQSTSSSVNRVPFLSEIPILGTLFKRQEFTRKERELVIVVTPRLVKPLAANVAINELMPGARNERPDTQFWQRYVGPSGSSVPGFSE